ncbi:MAG: aminotransferase class V-fold PLP-dependent enzyme [Acidobacteriia bacterium]|jgi:L-seryl-tRNA(Ser) seleniumtransferase|nr:aminotransferase class V-fold PLP-dependent enzyme [Terriglobia bacterium]
MLNDIYQNLGVTRIINAAGTLTRLGGPPMVAEAVQAMKEASQWSVRIEELQERAGTYLAEVTGAEAGYVTSGASAGLQLAAAACIAGLDIRKMESLPDTSGMPNEIIVQRSHRNGYDHALRSAGARLVEVGHLGNPTGGYIAPWHIESAIHTNTVAIHWVCMDLLGAVSLKDTITIAHRHHLPVIVDAAAALPPMENLQYFISEGADLVVFSGGKAIRGPQASGILVGRRDLIESVSLQHQDMDVLSETWTLREKFLKSNKIPGPPSQGIGRSLKVGKEEIAGLVVALKTYVKQDHSVWNQEQNEKLRVLKSGLQELPDLEVESFKSREETYPKLRLGIKDQAGITVVDIVLRLLDGDPAVAVGQEELSKGYLIIDPISLTIDQLDIVIKRFSSILFK